MVLYLLLLHRMYVLRSQFLRPGVYIQWCSLERYSDWPSIYRYGLWRAFAFVRSPGLGVDLVEEEMESIRVLQEVILLRTFIFIHYTVSNRLNRKSGPDNRSVLVSDWTHMEFAVQGLVWQDVPRKRKVTIAFGILQACGRRGLQGTLCPSKRCHTEEEGGKAGCKEWYATLGLNIVVFPMPEWMYLKCLAECSEKPVGIQSGFELGFPLAFVGLPNLIWAQSSNGVIFLLTSNHAFYSIQDVSLPTLPKTAIYRACRVPDHRVGTEDTDSRRSARICDTAGNDTHSIRFRIL